VNLQRAGATVTLANNATGMSALVALGEDQTDDRSDDSERLRFS
jgi:hypothetical protein